MFPLDKPSFQLLERSLYATNLRQNVIASNIANADVPNYKRSDIRFEELLQQSQTTLRGRRTHPRHLEIGPPDPVMPQVTVDQTTAMNNNGNNVDIDYEMALMAKNQLRYNTMIQLVNYELKHLRTAIDSRR